MFFSSTGRRPILGSMRQELFIGSTVIDARNAKEAP
jgi:hypothetical protein